MLLLYCFISTTRVKNSLRANVLGLASEHFLKEIINVLNTDRAVLRVERNTTTIPGTA